MKTLLIILSIFALTNSVKAQYVKVSPDTATRTAPDTVTVSASICQCGAVITAGVWSQTFGPLILIPNMKANTNVLQFKTPGIYGFAFNVTDINGKKYADSLQIKINPAPRKIKLMTINYSDGSNVLTKQIRSVTISYSDGTTEIKTITP